MLSRLLILLLIGQTAAPPQQPAAPTFRASANLIVQTVSVKDRDGKPIEGLAAADFVLTENGLPQQIAFVDYERLDTSPASERRTALEAVTADATSSRAATDARYRGRRLLILYFDLYNMPLFDQARMYAAADKYIATQMAAADIVSIVVFDSGRVRLASDFSDDRAALRAAIDELRQAADARERGDAVLSAGGAFGEDDETFNLFTTDRQLAALQTAVTGLGHLPEVKTLVYFGSGLRLNGADNQAQLRATVNAAVRANVTINPIDTRGLMASAPLGDATRPSPGGVGMFSGSLAQAEVTKQQQSQDTYYALAKDTGGLALFDYNDLSRGIRQAAQAITGYYMIGYYTAHGDADGRFRRVKITLASGARADLSYRAGYYGVKTFAKFNAADKERQLEEALRLEDPITAIPMALEVNYFRLTPAEYFVPVSVRIPGSELTRPAAGAPVSSDVDMLGEVKDEFGVTIRNVKDRLTFRLDAAAAARISRKAIQYETGFTLLPGNYVIKVLARDGTTGRIGTFQHAFAVPNLDREQVRVPISSVVLGTQWTGRSEAVFNVREKINSDAGNPLVSGGRKLVPSVTRTFTARQPLFVLLQSYRQRPAAMQPLAAYAAIYRDGVTVFQTEPLGIRADPSSMSIPIRFTMPLSSIEPGSYYLQVTVLDPAAGRAAFWRAPIVVVR